MMDPYYPVPFLSEPLSGISTGDAKTDIDNFSSLLPAATVAKHGTSSGIEIIVRPLANNDFLETELALPRLNGIHDHLWLAGRPMPPRPLNYQLAASRTLTITEDIHAHMVWEPGRIFLKPLPRYLLSPAFWRHHLVCNPEEICTCADKPAQATPAPSAPECPRRRLYACAYGLLLSYAALVRYESDFDIAVDSGLLPGKRSPHLTWESWQVLVSELLRDSPANMKRVNKRYMYGELRLSRLNKIVRFLPSKERGFVGLLRGYRFEVSTYGQQFEMLIAPAVATTAYAALVLTAMQVGLGIESLNTNEDFINASYGFTVFAIVGPLGIFVFVAFIILLFVIYNLVATRAFRRKRFKFLEDLNKL